MFNANMPTVINHISQSIFNEPDVSYASQHTFSKLTATIFVVFFGM